MFARGRIVIAAEVGRKFVFGPSHSPKVHRIPAKMAQTQYSPTALRFLLKTLQIPQ